MNYTPTPMQPVRPGAEDANKIPSLNNGQRTQYKPPVAQCVGPKGYSL